MISSDTAVLTLAAPLLRYIEDESLTELAINEPGRVLVETDAGWQPHDAPDLTMERLSAIATAVATYSDQKISPERPILSAILPRGERIQIVVPPATSPGQLSITIRKPSKAVRSLDSYVADDLFEGTIWRPCATSDMLTRDDQALIDSLASKDFGRFFRMSISQHRNICIVGDTGSGKTTFMKTLCALIPHHERVVTIEDVREIFMDEHPNKVHLLYSKGDQGVAKVSPASLIASCMRMKPNRVLLAELRGSESYDFLKLLTTGHSGSITSYHAASCADATTRFVLMVKEHAEASTYQESELRRLLFSTMDIIAHVKAEPIFSGAGQVGKRRLMTEIYFDPKRKIDIAYGV